ncbi:hypothetical protein DFQ30_008175 [Apophysomyces sp. BC1015]|nr:hypothetical protein DFQ30_008175 [Apophysomyces sp. BC1015]
MTMIADVLAGGTNILQSNNHKLEIERKVHYFNAQTQKVKDNKVIVTERLPTIEEVKAYDALVFTGSLSSVVAPAEEDEKWIIDLKDFIRKVYYNPTIHTKLIGICFGHQAIASALGGEVRGNPKIGQTGPMERFLEWGRCQGWVTSEGTRFFMEKFGYNEADVPLSIPLLQYHYDQVVKAPKNFLTLLSNEPLTGLCALSDFHRCLSFQGHPEFGEDFALTLGDYVQHYDPIKERQGLTVYDHQQLRLLSRENGVFEGVKGAKLAAHIIGFVLGDKLPREAISKALGISSRADDIPHAQAISYSSADFTAALKIITAKYAKSIGGIGSELDQEHDGFIKISET